MSIIGARYVLAEPRRAYDQAASAASPPLARRHIMPCVHGHGRSSAYRLTGRAAPLNRPCATLALAAATAVCGWAAADVVAAPSFPTHVCGYFFRSAQDFIVYNGGGASCQKATKLIKGFVLGNPEQHGTSDAGSYWTIKGEPGFKCTQSMGEGRCFKGNEIAGYRIKA